MSNAVRSLLCCAATCALILALMVVRQAKSFERILPVSDWAGEYLWIVAPYAALAMASAIAWRSPFFSAWVFACAFFATFTNSSLFFLGYIILGGRESESNAWTLFVGPVITWNVLGVFLVVAVIVRVVHSHRQRQSNNAE